jgi:hypothetical protein
MLITPTNLIFFLFGFPVFLVYFVSLNMLWKFIFTIQLVLCGIELNGHDVTEDSY